MGQEVRSLKLFMDDLSRFNSYHELGGALNSVAGFSSPCRDLADAAYARAKLEVYRGGEFSARELSLLSGVAVHKLRRMLGGGGRATTGKTLSKSAKLYFVQTKRWLLSQKGFKPSWASLKDDPWVYDALSAVRSAKELNDFVQLHRWIFAAIVEPALRGFSGSELLVSETGESGWNTARLADLARRLDLDIPLFVGKVAEVSMRQGNTT